ncbi:SGNH/GDSL hydrolase family protein [Aneurinibacillus terranovensis]|uniref:SGNH/GDSL hydrolase family protein n=1 Tax=Aneurinibacillus terranovensis TaxID=278991 RepID=UPI0003FFF887|nr:SGNH/GDSL hydrolase family protein [Aneurinibacillus terranovensis]
MRIVCFGDSVTRGISFVEGRLRILKDNYPALLQKTLTSLNNVQVINKGVFNDNSNLLMDRLNSDVLSLSPDYVLVEIGGNDCNFKWEEVARCPEEQHEPIVPLDKYIENIKQLIGSLRKSGAVPVLLTLPPLDPVRYYKKLVQTYGQGIAHWIALCGGIEHWHGLYNRYLTEMINAWNVRSIDIRTAFKKAGDLSLLLSDDGIHPTLEGYRVMSREVCEGLRPYME